MRAAQGKKSSDNTWKMYVLSCKFGWLPDEMMRQPAWVMEEYLVLAQEEAKMQQKEMNKKNNVVRERRRR